MQGLRNTMWRCCLLMGCAGVLAACNSLSKKDCLAGNWQAIGYSDGVNGYSPNRVADHAKSCAEYHVSPDIEAWEVGRQAGLKHYCTAENAARLGRQGRRVNEVCPSESRAELRRFNDMGLRIYRIRSEIMANREELAQLRHELWYLRRAEALGRSNFSAYHRIMWNYGEIMSLENHIRNQIYYLDKEERLLDRALMNR